MTTLYVRHGIDRQTLTPVGKSEDGKRYHFQLTEPDTGEVHRWSAPVAWVDEMYRQYRQKWGR